MSGKRSEDRLWLKRLEDGSGVKVMTESEMKKERRKKPKRRRYSTGVRKSEEGEEEGEKPSIRELTDQLEERKRDLERRGKGRKEPPSAPDRPVRGEGREGEMTISNLLWIPALLLYGFGDMATSFLVLGLGGTESNPLIGLLMELNGSLIWFALLKTVILTVLCLISFVFMEKEWRWFIPTALTGAGLYLVILNVSTILRLT
ncbi:hypothetical protein AKJ65_07685 [candidate division MSBL1 archaeon SCGC-AAA259E19]|uniref:DUF5658 domain-containing protein n=1 Tax=candidate division MSBL1 archaeon SCGC-AAA259E19 TaxID=1698264 RepID=A0A133UDQ7_9EURY|nr:hypothetical protein AKJ65_07685 [candidate division MSBL1 archaeon SCGC-AAA259E19]